MDNNNPITEGGFNRYLVELKKLARNNRNNPTKAESIFWNMVIRKKFMEYGFLRQKPILRFILDFYSPKSLLAIEIDGDSHENKTNYDLERDRMLSNIGIKTIRYDNIKVLNYLEDVFYDVRKQIKERECKLNTKSCPL